MGGNVSSAIASLIVAAERGEKPAAEAWFAALYSGLHRLAQRELAQRGLQASLGATTLLHEAYLDMAARDGTSFPDRARFMGYASRVMRGLIIDPARERHSPKNGGLFEITSLNTDAMEKRGGSSRACPDQRNIGRAWQSRAWPGRDHRLEVLLRLLIFGNRRHARRIRTYGAAELGEIAPLSASENSPKFVALSNLCPHSARLSGRF